VKFKYEDTETKIVQIVSVKGTRPFDNKPYIFGLGDDGHIYVYNWIDKRLDPIEEIDDADDDTTEFIDDAEGK